MARDHWRGGWGHHHDDGIDGGDVLAGLLIIGGIAAIASAASHSKKQARAEADPRPYPGGPDYDAPDARASDYRGTDEGRYADAPRDETYGSAPVNGSFDAAIDACAGEVERGERRIDSIGNVNRMGDRFAVEGRLTDGRGFACSVDDSGHIRSVAVDGHALI